MFGAIVAVFGLSFLGIFLGYGIGVLCGALYVWLAQTTSFEGYSGMLVFFGFAPAFAILGALALPAIYLVHRLRRSRVPVPC